MNHVSQHYTDVLADLLVKQQIPDVWVKEISIKLDFGEINEDISLDDSPTLGEPFKSVCQIIADNGSRYFSVFYGRCQPHCAQKEWRSLRESCSPSAAETTAR